MDPAFPAPATSAFGGAVAPTSVLGGLQSVLGGSAAPTGGTPLTTSTSTTGVFGEEIFRTFS
jgi:hypothetical protein